MAEAPSLSNTADTLKCLHDAFTAGYVKAKRLRSRAVWASYISLLVASISAFPLSTGWFLCLAVVLVALQLYSFACNQFSRNHYDTAEERRREHRSLDALGIQPASRTYLSIRPHSKEEMGEVSESRTYYDTMREKGEGRLIESLTQSAFETGHLAEHEAERWAYICAASFSVPAFAIWIIAPLCFSTPEAGNLTAEVGTSTIWRVWPSLFVALALGPHVEAYLSFRRLSTAANDCYTQFDQLRKKHKKTGKKKAELIDILLWMNVYDCCLASALPLSDRVWKRHGVRINERWIQLVKDSGPRDRDKV